MYEVPEQGYGRHERVRVPKVQHDVRCESGPAEKEPVGGTEGFYISLRDLLAV